MARPSAPPLVYVHAEALFGEQAAPKACLEPEGAVSVDDWVEALHLSQVVASLEEEEAGEVPPDPTFADTCAVVVDASDCFVRNVRVS